MDSIGASRSLGMDAVFQYLGTGVQILSGTIFYLIIMHMFNPTTVGAIALFTAIVGLFNIVFSFGLGNAAIHFSSYGIGGGNYGAVRFVIIRIIKLSFLFSLIGLMTLFVISPEISFLFLHSHSYVSVIRLLGVVLFGNVLFSALNGSLLGLQKFRLTALISIIIWLSYYFSSIILAYFSNSIYGIIYGWSGGILIGVALEFLVIFRIIRTYPKIVGSAHPKMIVGYSSPIVLAALLSYGASYADRFIVAGLTDLSSLGVYNLALLIAASISFIVTPFNNILTPKFSELYGKGEINSIPKHVEASTLLLSSIYVPVALSASVISPLLLEFVGGFTYVTDSLPLKIILISSAVFISQNIITQALASVRRTKVFVFSSIGGMVSNIVLSILLIPSFGLTGAAIGFSSVSSVTFGILFYFAKKEGVISLNLLGMIKIWAASALMYIVVWAAEFVTGYNMLMFLIYLFLAISTYIILLKITKVFRTDDKELVISFFPANYKKLRRFLTLIIGD